MKKIFIFVILFIALISISMLSAVNDVFFVVVGNGICEKNATIDERDIVNEKGVLSECIGEEFEGFLGEIIPVKINKGWNLMNFNLVTSQNFFYKDILNFIEAEFVLNPISKEYFVLWAKEGTEYEGYTSRSDWYNHLNTIKEIYPEDSWIVTKPKWMFSDREMTVYFPFMMNNQLIEDYKEEHNLIKGWNLESVTPLMVNKNIIDFKGTCDIEKVYFFNSMQQIWEGGTLEDLMDNGFLEKDKIGQGFAVKVSNDCKFDFTGSSGISEVPSLPN